MAKPIGSKWGASRSEWTLRERIEQRRAIIDRFIESPVDDPAIRRSALGWWNGYPCFYWDCMTLKFEEWKEPLLGYTNAAHEAAVKFLMRLAIHHGLGAGALWEAGRLCRELFKHPELWNVDTESRSCPSWPDCLGRRRYALSQEECAIIRDGEKVFQELWLRSGPPDQNTSTNQEQAVVTIPAELRNSIDQLPPDEGLRPAGRRERLWLTWNTAEGLGPAAIRDRWNGLAAEVRKAISPRCYGTFGSGKQAGSNRVKQALIRARKDVTTKPSRKPKTTRRITPKQKSRKT